MSTNEEALSAARVIINEAYPNGLEKAIAKALLDAEKRQREKDANIAEDHFCDVECMSDTDDMNCSTTISEAIRKGE